MIAVAGALLEFAVDNILGAILSNVAGDLYEKLNSLPVKRAFKKALGTAVKRYATEGRLALSGPLLDKRGILADDQVAAELALVLRFAREPDPLIIAEKWKAALGVPPPTVDLVEQSRVFLSLLESELRDDEMFRPVFTSRDLNSIAFSTEQSSTALLAIEAQLDGLSGLLGSHFFELVTAFDTAPSGIRAEIRDFTRVVEEKTRGFVGRRWIFEEIDRFVNDNASGYFFVVGEPGIGKSSLAAQLVRQKGCIHHFNIRAEGISRANTFLKSVCSQLIANFGLAHSVLPTSATDDAGFLNTLLGEVSRTLASDERCIIVIDALDESDRTGLPDGANRLYLPLSLPSGVFMVVTTRSTRDGIPRVACSYDKLIIRQDSSHNLSDIRDYVLASTARPGIQSYMAQQNVEAELFTDHLVAKSEGNFMYLRYVLPAVERGVYRDLALEAIPAGLTNYYEEHWRLIRGKDEDSWFNYKLPVIVALTVVQEPVSVDLISAFSKIDDRRRVRNVLSEWAPFLHEERVSYEGVLQRRYRLYHASFFDFIKSREEVKEECVDLDAMRRQISDELWDDLFEESH